MESRPIVSETGTGAGRLKPSVSPPPSVQRISGTLKNTEKVFKNGFRNLSYQLECSGGNLHKRRLANHVI